MFRNPDYLHTARDAVEDTVSGWADAMLSWTPPPGRDPDDTFVKVLFDTVLGILGMILLGLLGGVCYLLAMLAGLLVPVVLYGLPIIGAVVCIAKLATPPGAFDAEGYARLAIDRLPEDLQIAAAGLEGEDRALDLLRGLDNSCYVFTNVRIPWDGKVSETDLIVVTPAGITIVEVKNHKNTIYGDLADHELTQQHISRRGNVNLKTFYNPVKQVGTHVFRLSRYLRSRGFSGYVNSCVWFINDEVSLQLTDRTGVMRSCPVFRIGDPNLYRYLTGGAAVLSPQQVRHAVQLLEQLV
jgi:hypothetical protein